MGGKKTVAAEGRRVARYEISKTRKVRTKRNSATYANTIVFLLSKGEWEAISGCHSNRKWTEMREVKLIVMRQVR